MAEMVWPTSVAILSLHTSPLAQPGQGDAGGLNVYVRSQAEQLQAHGIQVSLLTRRTSPEQPSELELPSGIKVLSLPIGPAQPIPKESLINYLAEVDAALAAVPHQEWDLVHSHYWLSGLAGLRLSHALAIPHVHTVHTLGKVKSVIPGLSQEPANRLSGEEEIARANTFYIANTHVESAQLSTLYQVRPDRISVVEPGVDRRVFNDRDRREAREASGIDPNVFHIVFAGRIQPLKGPDFLLRTLAQWRNSRPDLRIHVSISGEQSGQEDLDLPALATSLGLRDVVSFSPALAPHKLAQLLRSADVLAMPSLSESFGLIVLEAQASGTPVIANATGGLPEAVGTGGGNGTDSAGGHSGRDGNGGNGRASTDGGSGGILVDPSHDVDGWISALNKMYDADASVRAQRGAAAAKRAAGFTWERNASLTLDAYRRARGLWEQGQQQLQVDQANLTTKQT